MGGECDEVIKETIRMNRTVAFPRAFLYLSGFNRCPLGDGVTCVSLKRNVLSFGFPDGGWYGGSSPVTAKSHSRVGVDTTTTQSLGPAYRFASNVTLMRALPLESRYPSVGERLNSAMGPERNDAWKDRDICLSCTEETCTGDCARAQSARRRKGREALSQRST